MLLFSVWHPSSWAVAVGQRVSDRRRMQKYLMPQSPRLVSMVSCLNTVCALLIISGHGSESKFDVSVQRKEALLRKAMIVYLGASSQFTGN